MNKTELLAKIEPLFFENAFSEVSMDDVARALDIKKASLYYHFASKEDMLLALLAASFERYDAALEAILARSHDSSVDFLRAIAFMPLEEANLFSIVSQRGYCRIEALRSAIFEYSERVAARLCDVFAERYGLSESRTRLLYVVIDAVSKRLCMGGCDRRRLDTLITEADALFLS